MYRVTKIQMLSDFSSETASQNTMEKYIQSAEKKNKQPVHLKFFT